MQSTSIEAQLQILLHDVAIKAVDEKYIVYYHDPLPLAAVSIWLLSASTKPVVEFVRVEQMDSIREGCMSQEDNSKFAVLLVDDTQLSCQYEDSASTEVIALLHAISLFQKRGVHLHLMDFLAKKTQDNLYITSSHRLSLADTYLWEVIRGQNFRWRRYSASFGPVLEKWLSKFEETHSDLVDQVSRTLHHEFHDRSSPVVDNHTDLKNMLRDSGKFYQPLRKEVSAGSIRCSIDDHSVKPSWWNEAK